MSKQFFNLIAGDNKEACILLYGDIGSWGDDIKSGDIVRELLELESRYDKIDVRINSMGGEVYSGMAIFNAFRNSKANISIYIDGVAASMGSIIAFSRRPVYMSRYAQLMLHSVQGGAWGNKTDMQEAINQIVVLEDMLANIYSERSGIAKEEIKTRFFDGKDHWLTAEEALNMKLIDGIYDTDPVPKDSTPEQVYTIYQNRYYNPKTIDMLNDELKKRPAFAALANDDAILAHIDGLHAEAGKVPGLTGKVTELENKLRSYEDKEKEARKAEITKLVNAAKKDGRIKEPQAEMYTNLLTADFENGKAVLESLTPARRAVDDLNNPENHGTSPWDARMAEIQNNLK